MRNKASWVIVKLPHQTSPKGDQIPHDIKAPGLIQFNFFSADFAA